MLRSVPAGSGRSVELYPFWEYGLCYGCSVLGVFGAGLLLMLALPGSPFIAYAFAPYDSRSLFCSEMESLPPKHHY